MAKTFFDHLKNILSSKSPWEPADEKAWNTYMINRYLSHKPELLDLVVLVQRYPSLPPKCIYNIYKEVVPPSNPWIKYIKSSEENTNDELLEKLSIYYEVGKKDVKDYLLLLTKSDLTSILVSMGEDEKSIKKLLK